MQSSPLQTVSVLRFHWFNTPRLFTVLVAGAARQYEQRGLRAVQDSVSLRSAVRRRHARALIRTARGDRPAAPSRGAVVAADVPVCVGGGRVALPGAALDGLPVSRVDGATARDCGAHGVVESGSHGSCQWRRHRHLHCREFLVPHVVC